MGADGGGQGRVRPEPQAGEAIGVGPGDRRAESELTFDHLERVACHPVVEGCPVAPGGSDRGVQVLTDGLHEFCGGRSAERLAEPEVGENAVLREVRIG